MIAKLKTQNELLQKIPEILFQDLSTSTIDLHVEENSNIWLVAIGKGAVKAASLISKKYNHQIIDGLVIASEIRHISDKIQVFKGEHPIPDEETIAASYEVLDFVKNIPAGDKLVFCVSGGASSMFTIPPFGIEISEIQELYSVLLTSGASIEEMNIVRKHVCDVKGGKLANEIDHLELISVIESDVPGDDLSTIGSGPTIPDPSTFIDAVKILKKLEIWDSVSMSIQEHLVCGMEGVIPENPKPEVDKHFDHRIILLDGLNGLKNSISSFLQSNGYNVWLNPESYSGTVQKVSKEICGKAVSVLSGNNEIKSPAALIYFGESTVKVKEGGKGGRNQELALMSALSFEGQHAISMLSMDTDGIDGPTDVAGAIVNSNTTLMARKQKIDPEALLMSNNSYSFHEQAGSHIQTGATGINLMDLQVVLID
ncbi:MAG: DUF4147 domain-containing protein [Balneola sp.]